MPVLSAYPNAGEPAGVIADSVSIRVGPSQRSEILGSLNPGDRVEILKEDGDWSMIAAPPNLYAYIYSAYVIRGEVTGNRVNYRSGPGLSYARLGQFDKGEKIAVAEELGKWIKFPMPPTARLWVFSDYLEKIEADLPPVAAPLPSKSVETKPETVIKLIVPSPLPAASLPRPSPTPLPVKNLSSAPLCPETITKVGYIRELPVSRRIGKWTVAYKLVRARPDTGMIAWLCGDSVDLMHYHDRKVRIYAQEIQGRSPMPLYNVTGSLVDDLAVKPAMARV